MPVRTKLRECGRSFISCFEAFLPSRSAAQSSVSLPDPPASGITLNPSASPRNIQTERNVHATLGNSVTKKPTGQAAGNPPILVVTQPTDQASSVYQSPSIPNFVPPGDETGAPHTSVTAPGMAAASVASFQGDSWAGLKTFLRVLDQSAGAYCPLKAVVEELVGCIEIYEKVSSGRDEFKTLKEELENLFETLRRHFSRDAPPTMTTSMESLCKSILQEISYVKEKQGRSTIKRYLEAGEDSDGVLACYRRIQGHLQRLSLNANLSMWRVLDEQATEARLDRLCPSLSACYNSRQAAELKRGACTPGTRIDVLGGMYDWVHSQGEGSVYWLNGMAGTGKTTIAYSLCIELEAAHNLGASFFCSRSLPECRDVNQIVPSIAYQLAHFSRPFRWALSRVLEKDRNVHTQLLHIQFERLIVKPLVEVQKTLPDNLVVVIDALDECDDKKSTGQILEALLTKTMELPIKVFMASRPEPEIRDQMRKQGSHQAIARLVLHELDEGMVQGDIETYLKAALAPITPSELEIAELVQRAGILFIYAATVARYIGYDNFGRNPRSRLKSILDISTSAGTHTYQEIDELYSVILKAALEDPGLRDEEREDMVQVLYTALCAREPLTIGAISGLLGLDDIERVHAALRPLWSVLHVVESSELVTTLHASFPDYMFDAARSKGYCCDPATQDHALTRCCFQRIEEAMPQFNICGLESSFEPDDKIANLRERVDKAISFKLIYACRYWAAHLERAKVLSDLTKLLEDFLSARLLIWMEIMNLNQCMGAGIGVIRQAEEWCLRQPCSEDLKQLARDAWRFVAAFALSPASQSTPHIYVSMLPFWPESSPIARHYAKRIKTPMMVHGSAVSRRQLTLLAMWSMDGSVSKVAWSPDGTRVASVAGGQIFLLDSVTGRIVVGPLQQKPSSVLSIAFSPNSTRLVSGSEDGSVGVWDAQSGKQMLGPLRGHTNSVHAVAFSCDGGCIASGSEDRTICVWDAKSGRKVLGPLEGHTNSVTTVAFSPDSTRIASGSNDSTLRTWDARSGQAVLGPLQGHTSDVSSVAFSPDGAYIISGSHDTTVRMWDAQSGRAVPDLFRGHTDSVSSIAFSPDGTHIVSGSYDNAIHIWDAQIGRTKHRPLQGHSDWIMAVAFSPDGTRIISGSRDKTIRVWDARGGQTMHKPLEGLTDSVTSVKFSPDGTRILSGSRDTTLCIWDPQSGEKVLGPLQGHGRSVTSVAFSPDGTRIASSCLGTTIRLWDARSGKKLLNRFEGHTTSITSVTFSPDGARILSSSQDRTILIWDVRSGRVVLGPLQGHTDCVTSAAFSPDGSCIVSGSRDATIRVWDSKSGQGVLDPLVGHIRSITAVAFSPDGTRIASGSDDTSMRTWDAQSGKQLLGPLSGHTRSITSVIFSADGTRIFSASSDTTIRIWDASSGQTLLGPLEGHTRSVTSVASSPDGARIVSGSSDGTLRVWDAQSGKEVTKKPLAGHTDSVTSVQFATDGTRIFSGSRDMTIRVWDARSGKKLLGPLMGHSCPITSLALSPDGTRIASSSLGTTIRLWDARSGRSLNPFQGHTNSITSVTFSPDGTHILSGSVDHTICMWDVRSGRMVLGPLKGHDGSVTSAAFSPDGSRIVSSSQDATIRVWDSKSGQMVLRPLEGHGSPVTTVAFSPDGSRIASGSRDGTILVWDARRGKRTIDPLRQHTYSITSIMFSPDGTRIVSSSDDSRIIVWDAHSGQPVLSPLEEHTDSVASVAFSPDGICIISGSHDNTIRMWDAQSGPIGVLPRSLNFSAFTSWRVNTDGWVIDKNSESKLLLWIPSDVRNVLLPPGSILRISPDEAVGISFAKSKLGESWIDYYQPA